MKRLLLLLMLPGVLHAQALALPRQPQPEFVQHLDAPIPLSAVFTDDDGSQVRLAQFFSDRPVVLMLGYYHCPNLCSTTMEGTLEALSKVDLPRRTYRLLAISIDPEERAPLAAKRKVSFEPMLGQHPAEMHLLTGSRHAIAQLAQSVGFEYVYDKSSQQYIHPAGFLVATPGGRVSHYFMGVRFEPKDVRLALIDASAGRIGSPVDRLLLLCSHYDPQTGRYTFAAMTAIRIVCIAVLLALGLWIWRRRTPLGGPR